MPIGLSLQVSLNITLTALIYKAGFLANQRRLYPNIG